MRRLILLAFLVFLALPAFAVKGITVAQLEQALATVHASPDAVVAEQIAGYELTERLMLYAMRA